MSPRQAIPAPTAVSGAAAQAAQAVRVAPAVQVVRAAPAAAAAARIDLAYSQSKKYKQTVRSDRSACIFWEGMLSDGKCLSDSVSAAASADVSQHRAKRLKPAIAAHNRGLLSLL